jgi:aspartyl-tRNA(Asn)/glutamyl-tRNA(Gln) amidotransferase subunit A
MIIAEPAAAVRLLTIDGQTVDATYLQGSTAPLSIARLLGLAMRFGTSKERLPMNVQITGNWQAESTSLHVASLLKGTSQVGGLRPAM